MSGKLYLIPTLLGNTETNFVLPPALCSIVLELKHFIVEDIRSARRFLKVIDKSCNIDSLTFYTLNEHTSGSETLKYLDAAKKGESIGLLSEAGVPCVADPGNIIVRQAHINQIEVVPLVGPSSIILALMASGLNGQNFAFNGYLPVAKTDRSKAIKNYEKRAISENQTQLFIEAPYRNNQLFDDIINTCQPNTYLLIACDITLPTQHIKTAKIIEWRNSKPELHKRPVIFGIGI
jgi:16S rRNA (cytidine1402-2'-O)-methyltransferase